MLTLVKCEKVLRRVVRRDDALMARLMMECGGFFAPEPVVEPQPEPEPCNQLCMVDGVPTGIVHWSGDAMLERELGTGWLNEHGHSPRGYWRVVCSGCHEVIGLDALDPAPDPLHQQAAWRAQKQAARKWNRSQGIEGDGFTIEAFLDDEDFEDLAVAV